MDIHSINEWDGDDADEDLETFLANRRRLRTNIASKDEARRFVDTGLPQSWQTLRSAQIPAIPTPAETTTAPSSPTAAASSTQRHEARERADKKSIDEYAFLDINNLDNPLEGEWYIPSPHRKEAACSESPLFVQQHHTNTHALQSSSTIQVNKLLPNDYDSESQFSGSRLTTPVPSLSQLISGRQELKVNTLRAGTMHDVFAQGGYAKAIRKNPYTSGLFDYQPLSKEDVLSKSTPLERVTRQYQRSIQRTPRIAGNVKPQERLNLGGIDPVSLNSRMSTSCPAEKKVQLKVMDSGLSSISDKTKCSSTTRSPPMGPTSTQDHRQDGQFQGRPDYDLDSKQLVNVFRKNVRLYEAALAQLGCEVDADSAHWCTLESRISSQISSFIERLHNEKNLDVEDFKVSLEAWDMDIGVQVIMQKYIMYSSLLKSVLELAPY